jgi:glycosyltransferase involved in cell wall biosynthesis
MKLLAITPVDHPGGAETTLLRLLAGLRERGWTTGLTTPGQGPVREMAIAAGHSWRRLTLGGLDRGSGKRVVASWPAAHRLARGVDVVYLNGGVCGRLLPALPHRGSRPARLVLHVHDMVERVPRFWGRADVVLAASNAVADRLGELNAHVVYPPVDLDPPPAPSPWPTGNGPVVGFVGRIEPRKGPLDLVRAAPAIRAQVPGTRVVVVGDDPYSSDPVYAREVIESHEVDHHPWSSNAPGLMRHLDVLVLPSHQEPAGTVLAESMAVGTPVVATRVDGLPEIVEDGVTGRLVDPGDPQGLAGAVVEVLSRRHEMGLAAREHARGFATELYVERVSDLITP